MVVLGLSIGFSHQQWVKDGVYTFKKQSVNQGMGCQWGECHQLQENANMLMSLGKLAHKLLTVRDGVPEMLMGDACARP